MLTKTEHLAWCEIRARKRCETGDITRVLTGLAGDFRQHAETADYAAQINTFSIGLVAESVKTREQCLRFLKGLFAQLYTATPTPEGGHAT
jgi:hypothetical protein